jgi:hypothetical protein
MASKDFPTSIRLYPRDLAIVKLLRNKVTSRSRGIVSRSLVIRNALDQYAEQLGITEEAIDQELKG